MTWALLLLAIFSTVRIYPRVIGLYRFLTEGVSGTPFDVVRDWTWKPKISFMIPSLNEGEVLCHTIDSIMASDYPKELIEILVVDDCSWDDTWVWMQKMRDKYPNNVIAWKNEVNKGKPFTLVDIAQRATGELVFTVDSDTIIGPEAVKEIVSCYADPGIGGVGGIVRVKNQNASIWTRVMALQFGIFFFTSKVFENQFQTARVLCGPIASFRRHIFLECIPLILTREFLGVNPIRYGEDAYVTTRVTMGNGIAKRWRVYTNFKALAWTDNPETFDAYLKQQLRWWRSQSVGVFIIMTLYQNIMKAGVIPTMIACMNTICNCVVLLLMLYLYQAGALVKTVAMVLMMSSVFGIMACWLYNVMIGRKDPLVGKIKNPVMTGIWYGVYNIICWFSLSLISYFTMDDGGWVTRQQGASNRR